MWPQVTLNSTLSDESLFPKDISPVADPEIRPGSLVEMLRQRAVLHPDKVAFIFLALGETEQDSVTFSQLDRRASAIAAKLQQRALPGTRACLFYPSGIDFIAALFGCFYAGLIAVPGYPPRSRRRLQRLEALIEEPETVVALTNSATLTLLQPSLDAASAAFRDLRWFVTDLVSATPDPAWRPAPTDAEAVAVIQYTSGSTSTARGVMLSHRNLLHNIKQIGHCSSADPESRVLTWLPPYHDMGLISQILAPVYVGCWCAVMSPAAFMQRPSRWLQAVSRYRVTISGGPNFAYDLCTRKVSAEERAGLDLSSWEVAYNGAEAVRPETLEKFTEAFAPCGFRHRSFMPCYGLAEATVMVTRHSFTRPVLIQDLDLNALSNNIVKAADGNRSVRLTGCGQPMGDTDVRIVDPESGTVCTRARIGEIWVSGPSVARGYWNRPVESEACFRATLDGVPAAFLRTGDLGYMDEGELFVTGRLKDLIVIRGANYYPQSIEASAEGSHPAIRQGSSAAFGIDLPGTEGLAVVMETEPRSRFIDQQLFLAVRTEIAEAHGLETAVLVLVEAGTVPKTSSGKIRRSACKASYLTGDLKVIARWPATDSSSATDSSNLAPAKTGAEIRSWISTRLGTRTGDSFADSGMESSDAVALVLELERWLGRPVSPTVVWDYPSINLLSAYLAGEVPLASARTPETGPVTERIAVIGMGCRFPNSDNPGEFWQMLQKGRSGIKLIPSERWESSGWKDTGGPERWGGVLSQIDQFDPYFFGITPREANSMDPQQRFLLEVAWEALEDAGQAAPKLAGSRTGVFIGTSNLDYAREQTRAPKAFLDIYSGTGNTLSIAANRLSYVFDFKGPSLAIDTACSSSLTAVHLACESIRCGESDMAVAGGVNLMLSPEPAMVFAQARMLSPDGVCRAFDANANGYVRGEGCGIVVLKRLSDAQRDGDRISGVILASGVNQDGHTNGLTAPNGPSQQALLRETLNKASVDPARIGYIETHGTGTPLGDPIELQSLEAIFGGQPEFTQPCWLGSVKANIGHLEPAAGVASLIKTLLMLRNRQIPPQINFETLNPLIPMRQSRLQISKQARPWPNDAGERTAAVSSFGFGGTNACLIVAEYQPQAHCHAADTGHHLLCISARSDNALRILASRYVSAVREQSFSLADICYTANTGRAHFSQRFAVVVSGKEDLASALHAFSMGGPVPWETPLDSALVITREGYLAGGEIDWNAVYPRERFSLVPLPTYPFERERYWFPKQEEQAATRPLLGRRLDSALPAFEKYFSLTDTPFLTNHRLNGQAIVPAAAFLEMVLEAVVEATGDSCVEFSDVVFSRALFLPETGSRVLQTALTDGFEIFSQPVDSTNWVSHARGRSRAIEHSSAASTSLPRAQDRCQAPLNVEALYQSALRNGLDYGPLFRGLKSAWQGKGEAVGFVAMDKSLEAVAGDFAIHPVFLDSCFQMLGGIATLGGAVYLPTEIQTFRWYGDSVASGWVHAVARSVLADSASGDIHVFDTSGRLVLEALGIRLARFGKREPNRAPEELNTLCYQLLWQPVNLLPQATRAGERWLVLAAGPASTSQAQALAGLIASTGSACELIDNPPDLSTARDATGVVFLWGPPVSSSSDSELCCIAALQAVQALTRERQTGLPRLWLVTQGLAQSCLRGLGSVISLEYPALRCTQVELETGVSLEALLPELMGADGEDRISLRAEGRFVARLAPLQISDEHPGIPFGPSYRLVSRAPGNLKSLYLATDTRPDLELEEVEIEVWAAGLNFSDVMKAMGLYPGMAGAEPVLGAECSGVVVRTGAAVTALHSGDEVIAISPHSFAPFVRTHQDLVVLKPQTLRFEEAATIPVAFLTAAWGLRKLAHLRKGERILIHAGTGGVGLAAIKIAKLAGAEIYATAGSPEKRAWLESQDIAGVFDSRSLAFADRIFEVTAGCGVDVVLNSLAGPAMLRSLDVLAPHGRFLEIGKADIYQDRSIGLRPFQKAISYFSIDLDRMFRERRDEIHSLLTEICAEFASGALKPLPLRVFPIESAEEAFRHMAQSKHIGKIILRPSPPQSGSGMGSLFHAGAVYLIAGGTGALGLQIAAWMVQNGATRIVLVSRRAPSDAAETVIGDLRRSGAEIAVISADISQRTQVEGLLSEIGLSLRGIIHAAGIIEDGSLSSLDANSFNGVFAPKVEGAWNLHQLTLGIQLDFFVLFSSLASVTGSPGQGNYAAANAFLDSLAEYRSALGVPGLSINWGPWAGMGMAADKRSFEGIEPRSATGYLSVLSELLPSNRSGQVVVASADWKRLIARMGTTPPLLLQLAQPASASVKPKSGIDRNSLMAVLPPDRRSRIEQHIREQIAMVSGVAADRIDPNQSLSNFGVDSLTSLDLISRLEQTLQITVPSSMVTENLNVSMLATHIEANLVSGQAS